MLVREGEPADGLHIVESGHLVVRRNLASGENVMLDVVGPGAVLGEVAVLPSRTRSATVVALDDCSTRVLSVAAFAALSREHPGVATAVGRLLAERVERLTEQLSEALHVAVDERVARRLVRVAAIYGGVRRAPWSR